ncbi:hypothetical protein [Halobaculum lipolyticum]|uniref:Uncharacterized protein n=1 Tax=Halobaculum lipolyticum TaxID=3032001 RepID=A0ABD5WBR8_9EURY|nr:hypothetical protein [Halobaculum sp. DT31]
MSTESDGPAVLAAATSAVGGLVARLTAALPFTESRETETLSPDEAIRRAHALGVAAAFGADTEAALEEVRTSLDATYDRSIVDLAYREGKGDADAYDSSGRPPHDPGTRRGRSTDAGDRSAASPPDDEGAAAPTPAGTRTDATELPAVLERAGLLDGGSDLGALGFPDGLGDPSENEGSNP